MIVLNLSVLLILSCFLLQLKPELSLDGILKKDTEISNNVESLVLVFKPKQGVLNEVLFCQYLKWKSDFTLNSMDKFDFELTDFEQISRAEISQRTLQFSSLVDVNCRRPNVKQVVNINAVQKSPWRQIFLSNGSSDILLNVDVVKGKANGWQNINSNLTAELFASTKNSGLENQFDIFISGKPAFEHFILDGLKQIIFLNVIFTLVLIFLFWFIFGTFKLGVVSVVPFSFAGISLYGLMGLFHQPINILMSIAYLITSLAALQDFLFLAFSQMKGRKVWISHFTSYMLPGFFTSLTTVIGFGSLCISEIPVIRQFGIWTAIGSALEWYSLFLFFPCVIKQVRFFRNWTSKTRSRTFDFFERIAAVQPNKKSFWPMILIFVLGWLSLGFVNLNDSPNKVFPKSHLMTQSSNYLDSSRGWTGSFKVQFSDRENKEKNTSLIKKILSLENVKLVENPYESLDYILNTEDKNTNTAVKRVISDQSYYLKMFPKSTNVMNANLYAINIDLNSLVKLKKGIVSLCQTDCVPLGEIIDYVDFSSRAPKTLVDSLGLSVLLVSIVLCFLAISTFQKRSAVALVVASLWGVSLMALLIAVFQIEINFLTSIFSSILVGICGDNAIQFLLASRKKVLVENIHNRGGGALIVSFIMFSSGLCFMMSYFYPVRILGLLLSFGMLTTLIGELWGLRLLIPKKP